MRVYKPSLYRKDPVLLYIYLGLAAMLLICVFFFGSLQWKTYQLTQETEALSAKIEQQKFFQERVKRQKEKNRPDEQRIITMLRTQKSSDPGLYPQLLDSIEKTWSPRLAILNLKLEAGQNAMLEIAVADLKEAFLFVERLNSINQNTIAALVRHSTRTVENQASALVAHIVIERK